MENPPSTKKIVIQGIKGAFHEIAARNYFHQNDLQIIPAKTFDELITIAQNQEQADGAIMAIENSIAGSIMNNYSLINDSPLKITGELYLRIKQNLMVLPGTNIGQIKEVFSHPMAIAQCRPFFKNYPDIKLIENEDTALSAQMINEGKLQHTGAIASSLAADMYDLEIINESIETDKTNATRFLILENENLIDPTQVNNKTSISFSLAHRVGSLHTILAFLAKHDANLSKIQSVPISHTPWRYLFFIDFVGSEQTDYEALINGLNQITKNFKILGRYKTGNHYED